MFLVEIEAGREALYESVNAFVAAIRRGEIGPQSRIFHRASSNWISITLHPEFRKATASPESERLPPLARDQWTFYGLEPKGRGFDEAPAEAPAARSAASPPIPPTGQHGWRGLVARALQGFSTSSKAPEPSGT